MIQTWPLGEEASIKHQKDFTAFLQVYGCDILFVACKEIICTSFYHYSQIKCKRQRAPVKKFAITRNINFCLIRVTTENGSQSM